MPADLTNPFGPSCCDGGACSDEHASAQPCGCDPGADWLCSQHKFKAEALELVAKWRRYVEMWKSANATTITWDDVRLCADELEAILD